MIRREPLRKGGSYFSFEFDGAKARGRMRKSGGEHPFEKRFVVHNGIVTDLTKNFMPWQEIGG